MTIAVVLVLVIGLGLCVVVAVARDPGPAPVDVAVAYTCALALGDFEDFKDYLLDIAGANAGRRGFDGHGSVPEGLSVEA